LVSSDDVVGRQIFDAIVIVTSFTVDVVFVGGVSGDHGQKAAAALVVLLVWRVARVVDGTNYQSNPLTHTVVIRVQL